MPQIQTGLGAREPGRQLKRRQRGIKWLIKATGEAILVVFCVSLVYVVFLVVDWLIISFLTFTLSDLIAKYTFVANGFDGLRIFSAVSIVLLYLFHVLLAVFDQVRFMLKVSLRPEEDEEDEHE